VRSIFRDELVAGVAGATVVAAIEIARVGGSAGLALTLVALFAALGLAIGAAMALSERLVARAALRGPAAAAARALPALIALIPASATLFEGARASELPGAGSGDLWFPALAFALLAVAVSFAGRIAGGWLGLAPRTTRALLAGVLVLFAVVVELANRRFYRTEYPRVHTLMVVASCVALAVAARVAFSGAGPMPWRRTAVVRGALTAVVVGGLALALGLGLGREADRWALATHGNDGRHLVALARHLMDRDGDGFSAALGGGDCDDGDPAISPAATDRPGNGVDEDCDGADAEAIAPPPAPVATDAERNKATAVLRSRLRGMNVLLVSVDALRADVVSPPELSRYPALASLLGRSRRFARAQAPASGTDVSLSCLLTGRVDPFVPVEATLIEALRASGRSTQVILPREVMRWAPETLLVRGADHVDQVVNDKEQRDVGGDTTSIETTDRAIDFLEHLGDQPFAMWVHYFDVHEHLQIHPGDRALRELIGGAPETLAEKYRALVALTSREIGRLLDTLAARGLADHTVIVFFADHGESLHEDPRLPDNHGLYVYQTLTRVPLAIAVPGTPPAVIDEPMSLLDIYPTLADLLSVPWPDDAAGLSLAGDLLCDPPGHWLHPHRVLVMNESEQWGVLEWPYKLMVRPKDNLVELYDLSADPGEHDNLAAQEPARVRRLKSLYRGFPKVSMDRSRKGRRWRLEQARPPHKR